MCAQTMSALHVIIFTDYISENITILCASLAPRQWGKYSMYLPFVVSKCIHHSSKEQFELTCKMQISLYSGTEFLLH